MAAKSVTELTQIEISPIEWGEISGSSEALSAVTKYLSIDPDEGLELVKSVAKRLDYTVAAIWRRLGLEEEE